MDEKSDVANNNNVVAEGEATTTEVSQENGKSLENETVTAETAEGESKTAETAEGESKTAEKVECESKAAETPECESKTAKTAEGESKTAETAEGESKTAETVESQSKTADTAESEVKTSEAIDVGSKGVECESKTNQNEATTQDEVKAQQGQDLSGQVELKSDDTTANTSEEKIEEAQDKNKTVQEASRAEEAPKAEEAPRAEEPNAVQAELKTAVEESKTKAGTDQEEVATKTKDEPPSDANKETTTAPEALPQTASQENGTTPNEESPPQVATETGDASSTKPVPITPLATTTTATAAPTPKANQDRRGSTERKSNFLRQFRSSNSASGFRKFTASQFMEVWNHYDTDGNGYIEDHELDGFLKEFVLSSINEGEVRPEILSETAMAHFKETFMDAFDENQDGMIDIAELADILPTDENFLLLFHLKNPLESSVEFMRIWREYDKNCMGFIDSKELKSFLKHMLDNQKTSVNDEKLNEYTETILNLFDSNRDGKLQLSEMARLMPVKHNFLSKPILKGASCITRTDIDRLFRIYDQNKNGTIEDEELSGLLKDLMDLGKKDYTLSDINNMKKIIMDHWDVDHDGTISKSELRMFLIQQCKMSAESHGIPYNDEDDDDFSD